MQPNTNDMRFRILAVDDEPQSTHTLKRILEKRGYIVEEENDSNKALETAKAFHPDVVILDYSMPNTDGGDVAWQLASDPSLKNAKVIMCGGLDPKGIQPKAAADENSYPPETIDSLALFRVTADELAAGLLFPQKRKTPSPIPD